jgi:tol-pal system protein YbgF
MTRFHLIRVGALALTVAGCATAADLQRVRRDQKEMQARLADTQATVDSLRQRLDAMRTSLEEGKKRGTRGRSSVPADVEQRLAALEARVGGASPPSTQPLQEGGAPPSGEIKPPSQMLRSEAAVIALRKEEPWLQSGNVNEMYRKGLEQYRAGQCEQAITTFRQFIRADPASDLADNAQFWIGECYYARKDYNRAIIELNEVFTKYPKGDRVPAGLLALATAFADSGDAIDAKLILQKLISDHSKSEEAEVGRQKLKTLGD